jgi:multiple sugar transport system ATP-binding protein
MVLQNYALYPHLTVAGNLAFPLRATARYSALRRPFSWMLSPRYRRDWFSEHREIRARVKEAAQMLGIADLLNRRPHELSGGQRQRVALGKAIVRKPNVFLFDEPLSNLDTRLRTELRIELKRLHSKLGATGVYVTHDHEEAMDLGDRIVVMRAGRTEQIGTPWEIFRMPANRFVAAFFGSPAMNFIEGRLVEDGVSVLFAAGGAALPASRFHAARLRAHAGRPAVLGIRPDAITLSGNSASNSMKGRVAEFEAQGERAWVRIDEGNGNRILGRIAAGFSPAAGEVVAAMVDMEQAHYFAVDDEGRNLLRDAGAR